MPEKLFPDTFLFRNGDKCQWTERKSNKWRECERREIKCERTIKEQGHRKTKQGENFKERGNI